MTTAHHRVATMADSLARLRATDVPIRAVLDVGVQYSTPALLRLFDDVVHVLFEPIVEYYPHIRRNYSAVDSQLVEAAVSDEDGEVLLQTEKKTRGDEVSHSYIVGHTTETTRSVQSVTLDSYMQGSDVRGPYLLKIDVEGPEVPDRILRGATNVLQQTSVVVIEMTVDTMVRRASLLDSAGFDIWDIVDLCYYGSSLWQADFVFIHRRWKEAVPALRPMHRKPFRPDLWQGSAS